MFVILVRFSATTKKVVEKKNGCHLFSGGKKSFSFLVEWKEKKNQMDQWKRTLLSYPNFAMYQIINENYLQKKYKKKIPRIILFHQYEKAVKGKKSVFHNHHHKILWKQKTWMDFDHVKYKDWMEKKIYINWQLFYARKLQIQIIIIDKPKKTKNNNKKQRIRE